MGQYTIILEHTDAVDAYLYEQQQAAVATRQWVESQPENRVLRERLRSGGSSGCEAKWPYAALAH